MNLRFHVSHFSETGAFCNEGSGRSEHESGEWPDVVDDFKRLHRENELPGVGYSKVYYSVVRIDHGPTFMLHPVAPPGWQPKQPTQEESTDA